MIPTLSFFQNALRREVRPLEAVPWALVHAVYSLMKSAVKILSKIAHTLGKLPFCFSLNYDQLFKPLGNLR